MVKEGEIDFSRAGEGIAKMIEETRAKAKPLHELVVEESFRVVGVIGHSHSKYISDNPGWVGSGGSSSLAGYSHVLQLRVSPENPELPIRTLEFYGISPVRSGEEIKAKIPKYKEVDMYGREISGRFERGERNPIYHERPSFKEKEEAIEISLLTKSPVYPPKDGKIVSRVDRSVNYDTYQKR